MRIPFLIIASVCLALSWSGCGSIEETTEQTTEAVEPAPPPPPTAAAVQVAQLEYRIDSLAGENRRLHQQVDAMAAENRNLAARNAELESRINQPVVVAKTPPPPADATGTYAAALGEYRRRNFAGAADRFQALLKSRISDDLGDNCYYWIGESLYGLGKYTEALENFQTVFTYVHSDKKDDAQMMIGNCYLALRNAASARKALSTLVDMYPASPYVRRAQEKLAMLK